MHDPKYYAIGESRWKGIQDGKGDPYFYELGGAPNMQAQPWFMSTPGGEQPGIVSAKPWSSLGDMTQPNFMLGDMTQPNFMLGQSVAQPWSMSTPGGEQPGIVSAKPWNSLGDEPVVPFDYQGRTYGLGEMTYSGLGDMSPFKCVLLSGVLAAVVAAGTCFFMKKKGF